MKSLLLVAIGGVAGTLVRFGLSVAIPDDRNGTLAANLLGVALASALLVLMERRGVTELRHLLLPGFCAGMTTFSSVTVQVVEPITGGFLFLIENIVLSLLIVLIVLPVSRKLIPVRR
ncbi:CrcB protein [Candidatus Planktophila lacus]|uniref:fluoride efflux transporter FluC n=1 Tax=Candidatus Planktophila lacus TaxID=1884913 RepID=UPI000BACD1AE|nr:CrcB family protein [Candidatus Planktophila lacus]ASY25678.1 CrcB protein [Candidatus Planktophila lacus]ASY29641.1 CrcB protein [Candidatus Planktophila lacus]